MNNSLRIIIFCLTFFFIFPLYANAALIINRPLYIGLDQGLVGYWSFDGPDMAGTDPLFVYDRSGQGNHGSSTGSALPARQIGRIGQALEFDGVLAHVNVGDIDLTDGASRLSVSAWIYDKEGEASDSIVSKWQDSNNWSLLISDPSEGGGDDVQFDFSATQWGYTNNGAHKLNQWEHWVAVFDGTTTGDTNRLKMYRDGIEQSLSYYGEMPSTTLNTYNSVTIGGGIPSTCCWMKGLIDDVRIYNRALSTDEIKRLYNIGATFKVNEVSNTGSLQDGLVGYWSFDGPDMSGTDPITAYDRSGQGNHGSSTGSAIPARQIGKIGQALNFDGVNDDITISDKDVLDLTGGVYTFSAWVRPVGFGGGDRGMIIDHDGAADNGWSFHIDNNTATNGLHLALNGVFDADSSNNVIVLGSWQHVAVSVSVGNIKFYVDGVAAGTASGAPNPVANNYSIRIGGRINDNLRQFPGVIDDVRVYNRVLSSDEIKRLYNIGSTFKINKPANTGSLQDGLVGYWSFDGPDIEGSIAYDRSGNGYHGTLTNGPLRAAGKIGQALYFDGVNNNKVIRTSTAPFLVLTSQVTVSAWVKSGNTGTGWLNIFEKRSPSVGFNYILEIVEGTSGAARKVDLFYYDSGGIPHEWQTTNNVLAPNEWTHIATTFTFGTPSSIRIYVNGVSQSGTWIAGDGTGIPANDDDGFSIGTLWAGGNELDGVIDDVRIYNRALSSDEIQRLYNMGR